MDAFEGILQDPLTRNKYLYAHADPVNNRDPSGYMTMNQMMTGLAIVGTLSLVTVNYALNLYYDNTFNGSFRVWDAVAIQEFNARRHHSVEGFAYSVSAPAVATHVSTSNIGPHKHHPIPMYLCGGIKQEPNMVELTFNQHVTVHNALAVVKISFEVAHGRANDIVFGGRRSPEVLSLGRTQQGRMAIASGISAAYVPYGSWGFPLLRGAFERERSRFISGQNVHPSCGG